MTKLTASELSTLRKAYVRRLDAESRYISLRSAGRPFKKASDEYFAALRDYFQLRRDLDTIANAAKERQVHDMEDRFDCRRVQNNAAWQRVTA